MKKAISKGSVKSNIVNVPCSKSIAHRVLICAALAEGKSIIRNIEESEDIKATINALRSIGVTFNYIDDTLIVYGVGKNIKLIKDEVFCNESGSTLRFLIPLLSLSNERVIFKGEGRLLKRPLDVYKDIFESQGLYFDLRDDELVIEGSLSSGKYVIPGNISSQFISGLLFTLPLLEGDSEIEIIEPIESKSYIYLTIDALKKAGVEVNFTDNVLYIKGNQSYKCLEEKVPGDDSQAAFFASLVNMIEAPLTISNMEHDSNQGDHKIIDILKKMNMVIEEKDEGYTFYPSLLVGTEIDLEDNPDLGPVLFALASKAMGKTVFKNVSRLRIKESDRIASMEEELKKLGIEISSTDNEVIVKESNISNIEELYGHNDHRIVMALAILAASSEKEIVIDGVEAINKSYPKFFEDLEKIGVNVYDI